eukprot:tig00000178_g12732.t1
MQHAPAPQPAPSAFLGTRFLRRSFHVSGRQPHAARHLRTPALFPVAAAAVPRCAAAAFAASQPGRHIIAFVLGAAALLGAALVVLLASSVVLLCISLGLGLADARLRSRHAHPPHHPKFKSHVEAIRWLACAILQRAKERRQRRLPDER